MDQEKQENEIRIFNTSSLDLAASILMAFKSAKFKSIKKKNETQLEFWIEYPIFEVIQLNRYVTDWRAIRKNLRNQVDLITGRSLSGGRTHLL